MLNQAADPQAARATARAPATEDVHDAISALGQLVAAYTERRRQLAQSVGLTDREWGVLEEIATEHFMPSLFARRQESTPAAVSKLVRQLLDKGLVSVSVSKSDGRQRRYVLTAKGRRAIDRLRAGRQLAIEQVWFAFGSDDIRRFTEFASELAERLEAYAARQRDEE